MAKGTCSIDGCENTVKTRNWCAMHYMRWWTHGDVGAAYSTRNTEAPNKRGPWQGCWEWTGPVAPKGYGVFGTGHRLVHREVYRAIYGDPGDLFVLHRCDNPPCFRPDHLFLGTNADNVADMLAKTRQARGSRHSQARLSEDDVRQIRQRHAAEGTCALARAFGVRPPTISDLIHGRTWAWLE